MSALGWVGFVIALASIVIGFLGKVRRRRGSGAISRHFLKSNRVDLSTTFLAAAGLLVAAISARESAHHAETQLRESQYLLLRDCKVFRLDFVFSTEDPLLANSQLSEMFRWEERGGPKQLPPPVGFIPFRIRSQLFPWARPEPLLRYVGEIRIRVISHPSVVLRVRADGGVQSDEAKGVLVGPTTANRAGLEVTLERDLDALSAFRFAVARFRQDAPVVTIESYLTEPGPPIPEAIVERFRMRTGRLTVFVDPEMRLAVTGMLRAVRVLQTKGKVQTDWLFSETPHIEDYAAGGFK